MATEKSHRTNREISAPEVRLTGTKGEALGIVRLFDTLRLVEEKDVDLIETVSIVQLPTCRLVDYGKFKYQEQGRVHDTKLRQKVIQVKEVKFRPGTDDDDYDVELRSVTRFLEDGDRIRVTLRSRNREIAHQGFGIRVLERIEFDLEEFGQVEQMPKMEGRQVAMMLAPRKRR